MDAKSIAEYRGQIVELAFTDGARLKVHIISVDPDRFEDHVIYDVLTVLDPGAEPDTANDALLATSAQCISHLRPTDGKRYVRAPGSKSPQKPWWKFW